MIESLAAQPNNSPELLPVRTIETVERPTHLDAASLMKEKGCYFVHMIQVTENLDLSQNNKSVNTASLSTADKLDILYAANPTLSVSTLRPNKQDGTIQGGFGVLFSQGEIVSASPGDDGTIAKSFSEREIIGGAKNKPEDIARAIDRDHGEAKQTSYNEIVLSNPEVAAGFMKIDSVKDRVSYEESVSDYGSGGGEVITKVGIIDLNNEYLRSYGGGKPELLRGFDTVFNTLIEMKSRGPVYLMDENNQMFTIKHIDEKTRKVVFSTSPVMPSDFVEQYSDKKLNKYTKQEMLTRLSEKGIVPV